MAKKWLSYDQKTYAHTWNNCYIYILCGLSSANCEVGGSSLTVSVVDALLRMRVISSLCSPGFLSRMYKKLCKRVKWGASCPLERILGRIKYGLHFLNYNWLDIWILRFLSLVEFEVNPLKWNETKFIRLELSNYIFSPCFAPKLRQSRNSKIEDSYY